VGTLRDEDPSVNLKALKDTNPTHDKLYNFNTASSARYKQDTVPYKSNSILWNCTPFHNYHHTGCYPDTQINEIAINSYKRIRPNTAKSVNTKNKLDNGT